MAESRLKAQILHICVPTLTYCPSDDSVTQSGVRPCESIWGIVHKPGTEWSCSLAVGNMSLEVMRETVMSILN